MKHFFHHTKKLPQSILKSESSISPTLSEPLRALLELNGSIYHISNEQSDLLKKELKQYNYSVRFYSILGFRSLSSLKEPVPFLEKPGVYRLFCSDYPAKYIGQTGRPLRARLSEHRTHFNQLQFGKRKVQDKETSAMALHYFVSEHEFENKNEKLIHESHRF